MNSQFIKLIITAAVSIWFIGCGGGGESLNTNSSATVLGLANTALAAIPTSSSVPGLPVSGVTTSSTDIRPSVVACESITPSPLVDADSDGIALKKVYTFDCTDEVSDSTLLTRKGSLTVQDLDDTKAGLFGGLRVDFDITKFDVKSANSTLSTSFSGHWNYEQKGSSLVSDMDFVGTLSLETSSASFNDYRYSYEFSHILTPNNLASPFDNGTAEFSGEFSFSGEFVVENNGSNKTYGGTWVLELYTESLVYNKNCSKRYKFYQSGSIFIDDGNGNIFEYRYNCNSAEVFLNGLPNDAVSI